MASKTNKRSASINRRLLAAGLGWCVFVFLLGSVGLNHLYERYQYEVYYARLIVNLKLLRQFHINTPMERPEDVQLARSVFSNYLDDGQYSKPYSASFWQIRGSDGTHITSQSLFDCEPAESIVVLCSGASHNTQPLRPNPINKGSVFPDITYSIYSVSGPLNQQLRVIVSEYLPHIYSSEHRYQYSVAGRYTGLESVGTDFMLVIGVAFVALVAGSLAAVYWGAGYGLKPLNDLQAGLAKIRSGQSSRLDGDFPVEVRPIVEEFHKVISDRNLVEVENLAHRIKTPLSILKNQSTNDIVIFIGVVQRQTMAISQAIEHYLERARRPMTEGILPSNVCVKSALEHVRQSELESALERGIDLQVDCPNSVTARGDESDITELLREVVDNGTKWASTKVSISVGVNGESVVINVEDDGPGVEKEHREKVLDRGVFLHPILSEKGIGLAKAKEIAVQYGGSIVLKESRLGGLRVAVTLQH